MKNQVLKLTLIIALPFVFGWSSFINAQSIEAGASHTLFICSDSVPMSFGRNTYGQLGKGTANTSVNAPASIPSLTKVIAVSGGDRHSLFLKSDGTVWACGGNHAGMLGDSTIVQRDAPVQTKAPAGIIAISAGGRHSLFLKDDSTVWACGENAYGQLGDASTTTRRKPIQVPGLTGIKAISAGFGHSLFLKGDGTVWACGDNTYGALGNGMANANLYATPVMITSLNNIIAISAGYEYSLFLKNDGTVWACGNNAQSVLGDGTTMFKKSPVQVNNVSSIVEIKAGNYHSMFLKSDGTVWACGSNAYAEVGDATMLTRNDPVKAPSLSGILALAAGDGFSLFLKNDGKVWACGLNNYGQLGDGGFNNKTTPVKSTGVCTLTTGLSETSTESNSIVYPNPSNGVFLIKSAVEISELKIVNMIGEEVWSKKINSPMVEINLLGKPKGVYFYQLINGQKLLKAGKIIID